MTASPRPWYLEPFCGSNQHYVNDADGLRVADTPIHEDAELIVRVVNAHDALVAALEAVQADSTIETCPHCLKLANAALALAKGADRD